MMPRALLTLALICAATPALADQTITLQGGLPTPVPGTNLTLQLTDITDQRCPADVACVWEGMVLAEITVLSGMPTRTTVMLCNACDGNHTTVMVADKTLTYSRLSPGRDVLDPMARPPVLADYTLQITVAP
jgi:hypothetical protein